MGIRGIDARQYSKSITPRSAVGLVVGVVIGSGIFSSPGFVTSYVRSPGATMLVWFLSGFISLLGGWCYSELGASLPFTGGETVYFERAFGRMTAFLYVWVSTLVARPSAVALSAIVFADYACALRWPGGDEPENSKKAFASVAISISCVLQMLNTYAAAVTLSLLTAFKMVLVLGICLLGLYNVAILQNGTNQLEPSSSFENTATEPGDWVLAFANCLYAYNGWNMLNLAAAEVRDPSVTIPRAIQTGLGIAIVSFLWINISYLLTLDIEDISGSQNVVVLYVNEIVGGYGSIIFSGGVAISAFATCHSSLFAGAQAIRESGRSQVLPRIFAGQLQLCSGVSPTPVMALLVQSVIGILLIYVLEGFEVIVRVYVWTQWIFFSLSILALVTLRWAEPELDRPYKVWLIVPTLYIGICVFMVFVLFFVSPATCSVALVALLLGIPVFYLNAYLTKGRLGKHSSQSQLLLTSTTNPLMMPDANSEVSAFKTV